MKCVLTFAVVVVTSGWVTCLADDCGCVEVPPGYDGKFVQKVGRVSDLRSPGSTETDSEGNSSDWDWYELNGVSSGISSTAEVVLHVNDSLPGTSDGYDKSISSGGTYTYSWQWISKSGEVAPGGKLAGSINGNGSLSGGGGATNAASSATSSGSVSSASSIVACSPRSVEGASLSASGEAKGGEKGTVTVNTGVEVDVTGETREPEILPDPDGGTSIQNVLKMVDGELKGSAHYKVTSQTANQSDGGYSFAYAWTLSEPVLEAFEASNVQVSISTATTAAATVKANGSIPIFGSAQASAHVKAQVSCSFMGSVAKCVQNPVFTDDSNMSIGDDPGAGGPGVGDPGVGDPGVGDPGVGDPGAGDPGAGDPSAGDPGICFQ